MHYYKAVKRWEVQGIHQGSPNNKGNIVVTPILWLVKMVKHERINIK